MDAKEMLASRAEAIRDAIEQANAPQPLALADQEVVAYEELESQWVNVPFKTPFRFLWSWEPLLQSATRGNKDPNLAIIGLAMSWASEMSSVVIEQLLFSLGFDHLWSAHYLLSTPLRNDVGKPARTFGHKAIRLGDTTFHLVAAIFKGTTTLKDSLTDVKSVRDGFLAAGTDGAEELRAYVQGIEGATRDNTVLFITGHSLGAATANVVGRLTKDLADNDTRFVYTFASPNYECGEDENADYPYPNFRTFTNVADAVPTVPPGFPKIGIEYRYDVDELDEAQRERFEKAYLYFRGVPFGEDDDPVGFGLTRIADADLAAVLKNHLAATYMSFIVSELPDEQVNLDGEAGDFEESFEEVAEEAEEAVAETADIAAAVAAEADAAETADEAAEENVEEAAAEAAEEAGDESTQAE